MESLPFSTETIHDSGKIQTLNGFNHSTAIFPDGSNVQIGQVDNPAPDTSGVISKVDRNNKSRDTRYGDQLDWGQLELKQGTQNTRTIPHNSVPLKQYNMMDTIRRLIEAMKGAYNIIGGPILLLLIILLAIPGFNTASISHMDHNLLEPALHSDDDIANFNTLDHSPMALTMEPNTSNSHAGIMDVRKPNYITYSANSPEKIKILQHILAVEEVHFELQKLSVSTITFALGDVQ